MADTPSTVDIVDKARVTPDSDIGVRKAVALEYDRTHDDAPRVIASGKGAFADQILAIAHAQGIKVREDADLVEILSKIEIDTPIPLEAFAAVAEILSYVYAANSSLKQRRQSNLHKE